MVSLLGVESHLELAPGPVLRHAQNVDVEVWNASLVVENRDQQLPLVIQSNSQLPAIGSDMDVVNRPIYQLGDRLRDTTKVLHGCYGHGGLDYEVCDPCSART